MATSYIVDSILPRRRLHLVAGPTGGGKSKFIITQMVSWSRGLDVLGFKSHPEPWLYVSADRSIEDAEDAATSLGFVPHVDVPILPAYATGKDTLSWESVLNDILETKRKIIVWEGFGRYVGANPKGHTVDKFLEQMTRFVLHFDLTIIGIVEEPKMKPRDKYANVRQRISGPAAWGHHTGTVIVIEPSAERNPTDPSRKVWVIPHAGNVPAIELNATLIGGQFTIIP